MRFWPRSLFGRLALLLLTVLIVGIAVTIGLFRQDRTALLVRQFSDTKIVQLQALRAALAGVNVDERRETLRRLGREYRVRIVAEADRPMVGGQPAGPLLSELEQQLRSALGEGTMLRIQPRLQLLWVRVIADNVGYWVAFPLPPRPQAEDIPSRAAAWSLIIAASLLLAAFGFARYLARPLRELNRAVDQLGRGETPLPLPESGPSEIAILNRGFNRMITNLHQIEQDRALLLAGVSHDLRTPLARLRLGLEMAVRDESAKKHMIDDVEEMDRVIGQFLDFARTEKEMGFERVDPNALVAATVDRYVRAGKAITFRPGSAMLIPLRTTAFARLLGNLIDNALAYGAPPVEISTAALPGHFVLDVTDRGPGIPLDQVDRLKQPFTRASTARVSTAGVAGAGLGLAIVERIARLHGGVFTLLQREGGGTIAHVDFPDSASGGAMMCTLGAARRPA